MTVSAAVQNVWFWPKADILTAAMNVRYWR